MSSITRLVEESEECCHCGIWYEDHCNHYNEVKFRISSYETFSEYKLIVFFSLWSRVSENIF